MTARSSSTFVLGVLLSISTALAQPLPQPQGRINDFAGVIDSASRGQLQSVIDQLEQATTAEIAVVTVKDSGARTPKQLATELFNAWGVGKKATNNGFLLLLALKERRIETEVGYGLEGVLTDPITEQVLQEQAVPLLKREDWGGGLLAATRKFSMLIRKGNSSGEVGALVPEQEATGRRQPAQPGSAPRSNLVDIAQETKAEKPISFWFLLLVVPCIVVFALLVNGRIPGLGCFAVALLLVCGPYTLVSLLGLNVDGGLFTVIGLVAAGATGIGLLTVRKHRCPQCQKFLAITRQTLVSPTYTSTGSAKETYDCEHCGHHDEKTITLSKRSRSRSGSGSRRSGGSRSFGGGRSGGRGRGSSF